MHEKRDISLIRDIVCMPIEDLVMVQSWNGLAFFVSIRVFVIVINEISAMQKA